MVMVVIRVTSKETLEKKEPCSTLVPKSSLTLDLDGEPLFIALTNEGVGRERIRLSRPC